MLKKIHYQYIGALLIGLIITHITWSFFLSALTSFFYKDDLINVRNFATSEQNTLTHAYLNEKLKMTSKPAILILGSSFSYGYDLLATEAYSSLITKYFPEYKIINASRIGESGQDILKHVHYLKNQKISLDTLIIEINLFNFTASNLKTPSNTALQRKNWSDYFNKSYAAFYMLHPRGINLLTNLELNRLYAPDKRTEHLYSFTTLPDSYSEQYSEFKKKLPKYTQFLNALLSSSTEVAEHVYFFVSPIYKNGVEQTQFKVSDIQNELNDIDKICKQFPKIHCLAPSLDYPESNFMNLSHFNEQGHRNLAKHLAEQIKKNKEHQLTQVDLNEPVS